MVNLQNVDIDYLKNALINDEIHYQQVADIIFNQNYKPWHTQKWKDLRNSLIKQHCEQCETKEGVMVLQHYWHPEQYALIQQNLQY